MTIQISVLNGGDMHRFGGQPCITALRHTGATKRALMTLSVGTGMNLRKQARDIARESQRCDLSVEGLRLLLVSESDAADTAYA